MLENKKTEIHYLQIWLQITFVLWLTGMIIREFYVFSVSIALISIMILFWHILQLYKITKWKKLQGLIVKHGTNQFDVHNGSRGFTERYRPYYLYEYEVDGNKYQNDKLGILSHDFSEPKEFVNRVEQIIHKNLKTNTIDLYYNPKNPKESILINKFSSGRLFTLYIYLFFVITLLIRVSLYLFEII